MFLARWTLQILRLPSVIPTPTLLAAKAALIPSGMAGTITPGPLHWLLLLECASQESLHGNDLQLFIFPFQVVRLQVWATVVGHHTLLRLGSSICHSFTSIIVLVTVVLL